MKGPICEVCCEREADRKFRSIKVCRKCQDFCEKVEKEDRGTNLEDYEEYDEENLIVPKKDNPIPDEYTFSSYTRVAPRDLFNESKLLKCMGKLCIGIFFDGKIYFEGLTEKFTSQKSGFKIVQNEDGDIMIDNYKILKHGEELYFFSPLNNKENWPLMTIDESGERINVFNDDGSFSEEFKNYLENL